MRPVLLLPCFVAVLLSLAACKNEPKPSTSTTAPSRSAKPAPAFPDFESLVMLDGRDGGIAKMPEATDAAVASAEAGAAAAEKPALAKRGVESAVKLLEAGAEPRAAARYEFVIDKAQTTVATVKMAAEGAMPPGAGPQPPLKLTMQVTPKAKTSTGDVKFMLQVTKAEVVTGGAKVPPEVAQEIKAAEMAIAQIVGSFVASSRGSLSDVDIGGKNVPPEMQQLVMPLVELLFAPMPEEPIGVGAKWTYLSQASAEGTMKSTFTMTGRSEKGAEISIDTQRSAPPQPIPDPRAPPGATMQLDGKGKTKMTVRFAGITSKVEGDSKTNVTIKDPTSTPPRSQTNTIGVHHSLASP